MERAEIAAGLGDWSIISEISDEVLSIDPANAEAADYLNEANQKLHGRLVTARADRALARSRFEEDARQDAGFFAVLFSDTRRIGRLKFFLWLVGIYGTAMVASVVAAFGLFASDSSATDENFDSIVAVIALIATPIGLTKIVRRFHDINQSGWSTLFLLIPIANLVFALILLFKPGDQLGNNFGPAPS